jgi:predicted sulfurtransferase
MEDEPETRRLRRKLEKAERKGDTERAQRLRARLSGADAGEPVGEGSGEAVDAGEACEDGEGAEEDGAIARARRRLEKAVRKGLGADVIERRRAKLVAAGATAASAGASAAPDEGAHEDALRAAASAPAPAPAPAPAAAHAAPSASSSAEPDRSQMVLAKNGIWYPKPGTPAFAAMRAAAAAASSSSSSSSSAPAATTSLLLFYAYVRPPWQPRERARAVEFTHEVLSRAGCGGRLRVALEGFNGTLTGPPEGIRAFCDELRAYDPRNFGAVDFKVVDGMPANKAFRGLKVFPVEELVTYGLAGAADSAAPLELGGQHVKPDRWNELAARPGAVIIDVRNANETAIGAFVPPPGGATVLDPRMRKSTEFPRWIDEHADELRGREVMMYCTAGIRCERASALLASKGLAREIVQLDGGIHRYLDAFPKDGGIWVREGP